tara:strand:- start:800 stop:991 length:192 start_codon:yes stop_codon:yes gene_type:complete
MMQIDDDTRLEIRQIVVDLFKQVLEGNLQTNQEIQLEDCLQDIMSNKIGNYEVNVYGTSLRER